MSKEQIRFLYALVIFISSALPIILLLMWGEHVYNSVPPTIQSCTRLPGEPETVTVQVVEMHWLNEVSRKISGSQKVPCDCNNDGKPDIEGIFPPSIWEEVQSHKEKTGKELLVDFTGKKRGDWIAISYTSE